MALATRTISGNNSGRLSRVPKIVVMHSTRSGIASKTDAQELLSTVNWFTNPAGASSHWILSKLERVRCVADTLLAWHSGFLNGKAWGIEFTQPTIDRTFGAGHYANAALIGRHYVKLGVKPVWLDSWDGNLSQSGFVMHEDTVQGRASGKSDMGYRFDRARFIASLEEDEMKLMHGQPSGRVYTVGAAGKRHIGPTEWGVWKKMGYTLHKVADADIAKIPDFVAQLGAKDKVLAASIAKLRSDTTGADAKLRSDLAAHKGDSAEHGDGGGGVSEAKALAIAKAEDNKLKVTK